MTDSHESKVGNGKLHRENVYQRFYITIRRQQKGFQKYVKDIKVLFTFQRL